MDETKREPLLSWRRFLWQLGGHLAGALGALPISLVPGVAGYVILEGHDWGQAFLNATLLLGGYGLLDPPRTLGGRLFVGLCAVYSGLVFVAVVGLLLAPSSTGFSTASRTGGSTAA